MPTRLLGENTIFIWVYQDTGCPGRRCRLPEDVVGGDDAVAFGRGVAACRSRPPPTMETSSD